MPREGFEYSGCPGVDLPNPERLGEFGKLLARRRSERFFALQPLALSALSSLCFAANGVVGSYRASDGTRILQRTAPSAGAMYPLELFIQCNRVEGVEQGIYHYNPVRQHLNRIRRDALNSEFDQACCEQGYSRAAAVTFVFAAEFARNQDKYGDRGYRYVLLDIGHAAENLCLMAANLGLACFTSCGFFDESLSAVLRLDGVHQAPIYLAYIGYRKPDE